MAEKRIIAFTLNGELCELLLDPGERMLDVLRDVLRRTGTKEGCGIGECGACTVLLDSVPVTSCLLVAGQIEGRQLTTIEGLNEDTMAEVIRTCFVEEGAVQCGFCTPGMILSAYALLLKNSCPSREEIKIALSGNLCRCTGYITIVNAVEKAAVKLAADG